MKNTTKINALEDLKKQRRKVELEMQVTKREFAHSVGAMNTNLQEVLLKKVALPLGAAGLGFLIFKKIIQSKSKEQPEVKIQKKQMKEIKKTAKNTSKNTPTTAPVYEQKEVVNKIVSTPSSNPPIVQQKIVKKPKFLQLKKWLPIAIQLAKSGYSYYQNHYANNNSNSNYNKAVADNFLNPKRQDGNPYDRIPELMNK